MAIPLVYSIRSLKVRWVSSIVAVLGIAGTVGVFIAMLSLARGFRAALVGSGSAQNALVRRAGAISEMESLISRASVRIIMDAPGAARDKEGPLGSPEVVVIAAFPLRSSGTPANVQVRGVSPAALQVRNKIRMSDGRFVRPGLNELVIGKNVATSYTGFGLGEKVRFGGGIWTVVGIFDAGGSAFDSEIWCDATVLNQVYQRPPDLFQSVTVRLRSTGDFDQFKNALLADPRLNVQVDRELDYYDKQSRMLTTLITVLGTIVGFVMGIGAVFGALNTMYAAVAERSREIATLRALGFHAGSVITSFLFEAICLSLVGGAVGCIGVLPLNGLTTGAMNWQTFSHLAFAFRITPTLLAGGMVFALLMGLAGGVPPAIRAANAPVAEALREL